LLSGPVEASGDQRGHGESLAHAGASAADEGATVPAARLSHHRRKACETSGLFRFEGAELEHFDQQGEGGYGRDARNTGQDREPLGEVGIGLNLLEDRRLDRRDLASTLFDTLCIVVSTMAR
jgi:hypothetical protein